MIKHHLTSALRHLKKNPSYTLLNVVVLGVGFFAGLMMMIYGIFIMNYDGFHPQPSKTYSLELKIKSALGMGSITTPPYSAYYSEFDSYSAVSGATRLYSESVSNIYLPNTTISVEGGTQYRVDKGFAELFHFPLAYGNWDNLFRENSGIIISKELAERLPYANPVGETIALIAEGDSEYTIIGVLEPHPANSSLNFDMVTATTDKDSLSWKGTSNPMLFVQLHEDDFLPSLLEGLKATTLQHAGPGIGIDPVAVKNLYFESTLLGFNGDKQKAWTMIGLAGLIVLISVLNYINSYTSILTRRTKELGLRMILGSPRSQLVLQSLTDAFVLFSITLLVGLALVYGLGPKLYELIGLEVANVSSVVSPITIIGCAGLLLVFALLMMSTYPVIILKKFNPSMVLQADQGNLGFAGRFRLMLVGLQILVAVALINYAAILSYQMNYLSNLPLGFDLKDKVYINLNDLDMSPQELEIATERFKNELRSTPSVSGISINPIMAMFDIIQIEIYTGERVSFYSYRADPDFAEVMGLTIAQGDNITEANKNTSALINERAAALLYPNDIALGQGIPGVENKRVIGVTKDFYHRGFMGGSGPFIVTADEFNPTNLFIKIQDLEQAMPAITQAWSLAFPGQLLDFDSLAERYEQEYLSEQYRETRLMLCAALIAIILSSLGVIGIAAFNLKTKAKELSVRLVLGATWFHLLKLQVKYFIITLLIASIFGIAGAYIVGQQFLENYTVRPTFPYWILGIGVLLVVLMVFSAVFSQFLGFRRQNLVNNLRS